MRFMRFASLAIAAAALVMLSSCTAKKEDTPAPDWESPATLRDLIYGEGLEENQYTVYIQEDGKETPFLVLTDQYSKDGYCLLLRKNTLDERRIFNHAGGGVYYPGSCMDQFLTKEYVLRLSEKMRETICSVDITVIQKDASGVLKDDTETVQRTVFLLSKTEAGALMSKYYPREGEKLIFFSSDERRITQTDAGDIAVWWLRTSNRYNMPVVQVVRDDGVIDRTTMGEVRYGEMGIFDVELFVRPAFCLDPETAIRKNAGRFYLDLK